jgi:hypothetical protein
MGNVIWVHLAGVAPVPVGHEVEVRTYFKDQGVFSKKPVEQPLRPLVIDRDTGVVYGEDWHFQPISTYVVGEPRPEIPIEPRSDLRESARWRGKVTACRILWIGSGETRFPQTTLLVERANQ